MTKRVTPSANVDIREEGEFLWWRPRRFCAAESCS